MFALIDCNNFFASCERVFQPHLKNRPIVVLSRNDGCIIARSNEVKAMGIPMGAPVFKWREVLEKNQVTLFSSNFELYGDLSARVMNTLTLFSDEIQIYSVDEAFLRPPKTDDLKEYGENMARIIEKHTGIPVSVGIGPTKTLCKIATYFAKQQKSERCFILNPQDTDFDSLLQKMPVEKLWGVGRSMGPRLTLHNIFTALDLKNADSRMIKIDFKIMGSRLIEELKGIPCFIDRNPNDLKKSIRFTRSFSKPIYKKEVLQKMVAHFASMAAEKLRKEKANASVVHVFIATSRHSEEKYSKGISISLTHPSFFSPHIIKAALQGFEQIFCPTGQTGSNKAYKRAGVTLSGIFPVKNTQYDLFGSKNEQINEREDKMVSCVDQLNKRFGKNTIQFLAEGLDHHSKASSKLRSPAFTSKWEDLLVIKV